MIVIAAMLLIVLTITPFLSPYGSFTHLDGSAGVMDHRSLWTSSGVSGPAYALGDILCHQMHSRSFVLNGSQMAVCARDISVLIGVFAGLIAAAAIGKRIEDERVPYIAAILILTMAAEWTAEHLTGSDLLILRIITGVLAGAGIALLADRALARYG
jgi:uncharacterized membrane protein